MHQAVLNDAALALSRILTFHRIHHGFFGGFAILAKGAGHRPETKDIDVLVSAKKHEVVNILSNKRGWLEIPHVRDDYVAFFWNPSEFYDDDVLSSEKGLVLVELFVGQQREKFPLSKHQVLRGNTMGTSYIPVLSEEYLFRGKLIAAASRMKASDVQDIQYLVTSYGKQLKGAVTKADKGTVGLAVRRHPQLRKMLEKVGIETRGALWGARRKKVCAIADMPKLYDVQRGLGCA